ncbi:HNH endonuclease [Prevotella fusca]
MTEKEDFIIQKPYQPTKEEKQAIRELKEKASGIVPEDWDSKKIYIKSFKENLREDMYKKQNELCAFCRIHIPSACVPMHREHIVYKKDHPEWMFLPQNLCIACPICNQYKGTAEVLTKPRTKTYPKSGKDFRIIHPLYDKYSDHIELLEDILYKGKTKKGSFTIETCHLYRVGLAEERVKNKMYENNKGNIIAELINLLSLPDLNVDKKERFIQFVENIVQNYKQEEG